MTTSGTTAFSNTARDIVHAALDENGIIGLGETPDADQLAACILRLNAMLKSWQMQGMTWKEETITASGTADVASITLPVYVRGVSGVRYVESATNERALGRWERDEYKTLPNKAAVGTPSIFYVNSATGGSTITVWPVPSAAFTLALDIDRAIDTVTNASETLDIPEELTETVYAVLAVRCCAIFQKEPMAELVSRAQTLERQMFDAYRPASYFMGPA